MTRSKKGSKPPGYDFWSKRPKSFHNDKDLTRRAERREGKVKPELFQCFACGLWFESTEPGSHVCQSDTN